MKHKPDIYFRADGSSTIGLGHVFRSLALVKMLKPFFNCHFITRTRTVSIKEIINESCDSLIELQESKELLTEAKELSEQFFNKHTIVVLDNYHFVTEYQEIVKSSGAKLVSIDDIYQTHFLADTIINHGGGILPSHYSAERHTEFYLGTDFALLRPAFITAAKSRNNSKNRKGIFICFGGSDPGNYTLSIVEKCLAFNSDFKLFIIIGNAYQHKEALEKFVAAKEVDADILSNLNAVEIVNYMSKSQIAITSASTISYEYLSVGGLLYVIQTVDNQRDLFRFLVKNKLAYDFNDFPNAKLTEENLEHQKKYFDGGQDKRLQRLFIKLLFSISEATEEDLMTYYNWANDPETRAQSFNSEFIPLDQHTNWFQSKLISDKHLFLLGKFDTQPIGQLRIDFKNNEAIINYSVDKNYRGMGFGILLLEKGISYLKNKIIKPSAIVGFVKHENKASAKVFRKLGFSEKQAIEYEASYKYTLICNL